MRKKTQLDDDPVVREVRAARAQLWEEGGRTMKGLARLVKHRAEALRKTRRTRRKRGAA